MWVIAEELKAGLCCQVEKSLLGFGIERFFIFAAVSIPEKYFFWYEEVYRISLNKSTSDPPDPPKYSVYP